MEVDWNELRKIAYAGFTDQPDNISQERLDNKYYDDTSKWGIDRMMKVVKDRQSEWLK